MKGSNQVTAAKPGTGSNLQPPSQQQLHKLYDEASQTLEALFAEAKEQSFSTLMYLALNRLHSTYPHLSHDELEALFMGLVQRRQGRPYQARH